LLGGCGCRCGGSPGGRAGTGDSRGDDPDTPRQPGMPQSGRSRAWMLQALGRGGQVLGRAPQRCPPPSVFRWSTVQRRRDSSSSSALCPREVGASGGNTGATARWCSRSSPRCHGLRGYRSRSQGRYRTAVARAGPSRSPGPVRTAAAVRQGSDRAAIAYRTGASASARDWRSGCCSWAVVTSIGGRCNKHREPA